MGFPDINTLVSIYKYFLDGFSYTQLGTGAAVDVAGVAWGATENAVCDGVGQLSDPLEGHVI